MAHVIKAMHVSPDGNRPCMTVVAWLPLGKRSVFEGTPMECLDYARDWELAYQHKLTAQVTDKAQTDLFGAHNV